MLWWRVLPSSASAPPSSGHAPLWINRRKRHKERTKGADEMSFIDELKRLARPYEDEEDERFDDEFTPVSSRESAREQERRNNKVVNIHTTTQLQVVLVKPERFENASEIADHLRDKRTVVLNLEQTDKNIARRLIDFLSGVAYANEGTIKKVALSTYIITPYNVEILGDLIDELENNGLYF